MEQKKSRVHKRADKEIAVVRDCKAKYDTKVAALKSERDELMASIELAKEKVRNAGNIEIKRDITREVNQMKEDLENVNSLLTSFRDTAGILDELMKLLKKFYDQELYRFIVNNIPERKLPRLVKNPKKVDQVYDLSVKLLKDFNDQMNRILIVSRETTEERKKEKEKNRYVRSQIGDDTEDIDKDIMEIESEGATADEYSEEEAPAQNNKINKA